MKTVKSFSDLSFLLPAFSSVLLLHFCSFAHTTPLDSLTFFRFTIRLTRWLAFSNTENALFIGPSRTHTHTQTFRESCVFIQWPGSWILCIHLQKLSHRVECCCSFRSLSPLATFWWGGFLHSFAIPMSVFFI